MPPISQIARRLSESGLSDRAIAHLVGATYEDVVKAMLDPNYQLEEVEERQQGASAHSVQVVSVPDLTWTIIPMDARDYDTEDDEGRPAQWDGVGLTCRRDGVYLVKGSIFWDVNSTGVRLARITVNGNEADLDNRPGVAGAAVANSIVTILALRSGDVLRVQGLQNSGAALNASTTPVIRFQRLGPRPLTIT